MIYIALIGLVVLSFYYLLRPRQQRGKIVLAPSKGTVCISLPFAPKYVRVDFAKHNHCRPSCSDLEDSILSVNGYADGFCFDYQVETGVRTIKWVAKR